jgi:hypothetical protein
MFNTVPSFIEQRSVTRYLWSEGMEINETRKNDGWFWNNVIIKQEIRVSSVTIVSGYGLDDRAIEVRSSAEAKHVSSSLCVQTGSGTHPDSCPGVPAVLSLGLKRGRGRDADHSPPSSAEVKNDTPQARSWRVVGQLWLKRIGHKIYEWIDRFKGRRMSADDTLVVAIDCKMC